MNFKLTNYRSLTKQLTRIASLLERLADDYEASMRQQGLSVPLRFKLTKEEARAEFSYTDDEQSLIEEISRAMGKLPPEEEED